MQQRLPSRLDPPIAFAHRGAKAHASENTIEAFALALRLGATGLESDVWLTSDGIPVLDHDGVVGRRLRRTPIAEVERADLPDHIPTLAELLVELFSDQNDAVHLSLDVCDPGAYDAVADVVRAAGSTLPERTWLCDPVLERLVERREHLADFRLVHSTRLHRLAESPELHASRLSSAGIDAMNMHHTDWSGGLVVMFHRFDVCSFGWDLQFDHQLEAGVRMGLDAVYSDHVDVMMDVMSRETGAI